MEQPEPPLNIGGADDRALSAWLLVPSPLLGPSSLEPLAWALQGRGHEVRLTQTSMASNRSTDHTTAWIEEILATTGFDDVSTPITVVAHSLACSRAPLLVSRLLEEGWPVDSMVLVDGRFPDGKSIVQSCPSLVETLKAIERPDGYLPPWTCWWGSLFESLIPDNELGRRVLSEALPIPPSFFSEVVPNPDLSETIGQAFLSFGGWYIQDNRQARELGWLATVMTGNSMHHLIEPHRVTETLLSMVASLRQGAS